MTDVGRAEEEIVVVVIGAGRELLRSHEPRRFAMTEPLGHAGQRQTELAHPLGGLGIGGPGNRFDGVEDTGPTRRRSVRGAACDDPLMRLTGDLGHELEMCVVMEDDEIAGLGHCCYEGVYKGESTMVALLRKT